MKSKLITIPALTLGAFALSMGAASAQGSVDHYQVKLDQINNSGASGNFTIDLDGDMATVKGKATGLAPEFMGKPFPHVKHVHVVDSGKSMCPTPDLDKNGDGVVNTPEGGKAYGPVATTLSTSGSTSAKEAANLKVAGMGATTDYNRTFKMNDKTIQAIKDGRGAIVIHGINPADYSKDFQDAKSPLDPSLPAAATAPALCGVVMPEQMTMPAGTPDTGGGSTSENGASTAMIALGGGLVVAAGGAFYISRRRTQQN